MNRRLCYQQGFKSSITHWCLTRRERLKWRCYSLKIMFFVIRYRTIFPGAVSIIRVSSIVVNALISKAILRSSATGQRALDDEHAQFPHAVYRLPPLKPGYSIWLFYSRQRSYLRSLIAREASRRYVVRSSLYLRIALHRPRSTTWTASRGYEKLRRCYGDATAMLRIR